MLDRIRPVEIWMMMHGFCSYGVWYGNGIIDLANVPSDLSLLAFGIPPAREAESAGGMPKVPKGQGLGQLARWDYLFSVGPFAK